MSEVELHRVVSIVWVPAVGPEVSQSVSMHARVGFTGAEVRSREAREVNGQLGARARLARDCVLPAVPPPRRDDLVVEAGAVTLTVRTRGRRGHRRARRYLLAVTHGVVLPISRGFVGKRCDTVVQPDDVGPETKVAFGPSAVLTLVSNLLDVVSTERRHVGCHVASCLSVTESGASPYPPQDFSIALGGGTAADRLVFREGRWVGPAHDGAGDAALFVLFAATDRSLRPLPALHAVGRRNLVVSWRKTVSRPPRMLMLDSIIGRSSPRDTSPVWDAEFSLYDEAAGVRCGAVPIRFRGSVWRALSRVLGALGPIAIGLDRDPIVGDRYGQAPPVLTDLSLAECLEGVPS